MDTDSEIIISGQTESFSPNWTNQDEALRNDFLNVAVVYSGQLTQHFSDSIVQRFNVKNR